MPLRKVDPTRHAEKRQEVLDAAVRCFIRKGFHGSSVADLCAEAGMSPGHLYHYFSGKEAIVEAMVAANLERAALSFAEASEAGSSAVDTIAALLDERRPDHAQRAPLLFDMLAEAGRNPAIARMLDQHSRGMRTILADLLRRGQAGGEVDPALDPETVAPVLIALADGSKGIALRAPDVGGDVRGVLRLTIERFLSPPRP